MLFAGAEAASDARLSGLMVAARGGDRRSYATLFFECEPIIRRSAKRAGVRADSIDDVVQETFLTLHKTCHIYDPSRSFSAWLGVMSHNRAIDALRKRGRQARIEVHDSLLFEQHADSAADASSQWQKTARAEDVDRAVSGLTGAQREAVVRLAIQGCSLAQASESTGKTVNALKVNFHRALSALRKQCHHRCEL